MHSGVLAEPGCFAFYPNKQITTGEGGMIVTDDADIAALCRSLRNQGRDEGSNWLQHARLGFNFRMSDIQAALGVGQLKRLDEFVAKRQQVVSWYRETLRGFDAVEPPIPPAPDTEVSWFVFVVTLRSCFDVEDRNAVLTLLRGMGIECSNYFPPIHLQPYFQQMNEAHASFPVTESVASRTIALPFHTQLTKADVEKVVDALKHAVQIVGQKLYMHAHNGA